MLSSIRIPPTHRAPRLSTLTSSGRIPWFVLPAEPEFPLDVRRKARATGQESLQPTSQPLPLPEGTPDHLRKLHSELITSPYLEPSSLIVTRPMEPVPAPPLPFLRPRGSRRKRGGTGTGVGIDVPGNGLWSWFVLAQVKEGTEGKGSINRVVKVVRKSLKELASIDPSVVLPPNHKPSFTDGWAMLDVGDFAVHILSRDAREKWFPARDDTPVVNPPRDFRL